MAKKETPSVMGQKIFKLLETSQLLLLQDKIFPNIISALVGESVSGSWWSHPLANPIYNGLSWLEHNRSVLIVKLIDGKVTYLHENLFLHFYSIVCEPRDWQMKNLKDEDQRILKYISQKNKVVSDDVQLSKLSKDYKKVLAKLEKRLLVYSVEEHTDSGKHIKEYMTWQKSKIAKSKPQDYLKSQQHIESLVDQLSQMSGAQVKLPWR